MNYDCLHTVPSEAESGPRRRGQPEHTNNRNDGKVCVAVIKWSSNLPLLLRLTEGCVRQQGGGADYYGANYCYKMWPHKANAFPRGPETEVG